jgi:hypothetical protein
MNTWTLRRGYPILSVDPAPGSNASAPPPGANVAITQMPFHAPLAFEVGLPYSQVGAGAAFPPFCSAAGGAVLRCTWCSHGLRTKASLCPHVVRQHAASRT